MKDWSNSKFGPKALDFINYSDARINVAYGSVGSGKTVSANIRFLHELAVGPMGDYAILGKDQNTIWRNVLNSLFDMLGGPDSGAYKWIDKNRGELRIYDKRVWIVGAGTIKADATLQGAELAGAYCDEVVNYPEAVWIQLLARLRVEGAKVFATCNPQHPRHWFYRNVLDNANITDKKIWKMLIDENKNLPPDFVANLKNEYKSSPVFYQRYILGNWVLAEGSIYKTYQDNATDFEKITPNRGANVNFIHSYNIPNYRTGEMETKRLGTIQIGVDWGQSTSGHAFVASAVTEDFQDLVVLKSVRHDAKDTVPDDVLNWFIDFAKEVERDFGRIGVVYCDGAEQMMLNMLYQNTKYVIRNAVKLPIIERIRVTNHLLALRRVHFLPGAETVKEFLTNARYKEGTLVDERLDDGSYDMDSGDAFEYSFESMANYLLFVGMEGAQWQNGTLGNA